MRTSREKVRISDEAERVNRFHVFIYDHCRGYIYSITLLSLRPIKETDETRVRNDCLNFNISLCIQILKRISLRGRRYWDYIFLWDFRSRCSSRLHKIS